MKDMDKQLEYYLDIRNADVDLDTFARALAIQHMTHPMAFGERVLISLTPGQRCCPKKGVSRTRSG